jgi:hypothetical protein
VPKHEPPKPARALQHERHSVARSHRALRSLGLRHLLDTGNSGTDGLARARPSAGGRHLSRSPPGFPHR